MTAVLQSEEEIARRLSQMDGAAGVSALETVLDQPKRFKLTSSVVENLIGFIRNPTERWYLGFSEIDIATRGVGRGEVLLVLGRSHTGKSQLLLNGIVWNLVNNPDTRVVIFSFDEPRELVVMKLYCLLRGKSSTEVEESIKNGDETVMKDLETVAENELANVAIVDQSMHLHEMSHVMDEAREWWGCDPSFCLIDYLELLPGGESDASGVTSKAQAVKRWAKEQRVPIGLVHQSGRGTAEPGRAAGIYAGRYGGEQEAIFVLEVYRRRDAQNLSHFEKEYHANSINVNLCKNKRTARLVDQTYYLNPACGLIHTYFEDLIPDA